jgi:uncharacterized protein (DUF1800 family)
MNPSWTAGAILGALLCAQGASAQTTDEQRMLAGHLLRRAGFGATPSELNAVLKSGQSAWVKKQLSSKAKEGKIKLPRVEDRLWDEYNRQRRWYMRMLFSQRQLREKMTLTWHEHFATSEEKVQLPLLMEQQEELFRKNAVGRFSSLLGGISRDQAMLIWLDNDYNDGNAFDDEGHRILPNANYARELLQVFSTGPFLLNPNGTTVLGGDNKPTPAYSEEDVREIARALTGWHVDWEKDKYRKAKFDPDLHDAGNKVIFGHPVAGRSGAQGQKEVDDVVALIMAHPSTAPFISKTLIQKLATEQPSAAYVGRVSAVFAATQGDIARTVEAILLDPDFNSPAVVRNMHKTPIEHFVGMVRGLEARTQAYAMVDWTFYARHLVYYPPSVFSFYPPGRKAQLVNAALVTYRDRASDDFVSWNTDTGFDAWRFIDTFDLDSPEKAVDFLADRLLQAPLQAETRQAILDYMDGDVSDESLRGATWLVLVSPDFQRN